MKVKPFKELQDEWYARLKRSGFDDIENERGELKHYSASDYFENHHAYDIMSQASKEELRLLAIESTTTYYRMASQFLHTHVFKGYKMGSKTGAYLLGAALIRHVWELHSNGVVAREIAIAINRERRRKLTPRQIRAVIDKMRAIMEGGLE